MLPTFRTRLHIGHHFFGSGNIGDDFMLAGFLEIARDLLGNPHLTCCTPFDRDAQRLRLPDVTWLPYDAASRDEAVASSDAWIGVGDSPFQSEVGSWFLDHLAEEGARCDRFRKPMFYFCVGVNDYAAMNYPATRAIAAAAEGIWTRDRQSTAMLRQIVTHERVAPAADLAHVFFLSRRRPAVEPEVTGWLLNFEDRSAFSAGALCAALDALATNRHRWLVQEVRRLTGSEWELLASLPSDHRERLEVRAPDYAAASMADLTACWGAPETIVTSRYHGALFGAWAGAKVIVVERNAKLTGLVEQLELTSIKDFTSEDSLLAAMARAQPVDAGRLAGLAAAVTRAGQQLAGALAAVGSTERTVRWPAGDDHD
jgi:polysaccharide pyruvyl transferase WcaK-like protein